MYEWNETVQQMIDWLEEHLGETAVLMELSRGVGYSPYYCSSQFHAITGMTLKAYLAGRRLSLASLEIRDTDHRLVDIALKYGFSSQQAMTRAFVYAFHCTPAAYRKRPLPIPIFLKKEVLFPEYYQREGEEIMNQTVLTEPNVRVEYIPAHRYIGVWDEKVQDYFSFWKDKNCDEICGIIESMSNVMDPIVTCHTAGWYWKAGKRGYCYGLGVDSSYRGPVPEGFEIKEVPGSYYLVFYHPAFDFLKDCETVVNRVEQMAWSFDPAEMGFQYNEECCQDYQRLLPESIGYEVLRPVRKLK